jgi:hypothetical protein
MCKAFLVVYYENARYSPISKTHHRDISLQARSNRLSLEISAFHKTLCIFIGGYPFRRRVGGEVIIFISISPGSYYT